tara:strand:- start:874 stop:1428 length:555 start_codon:yes stop_codon:yes gene_type:complete
MLKKIIFLCVSLTLYGCAVKTPPVLLIPSFQPVSLKIKQIEIINPFREGGSPLENKLAAALETWSQKTLKAKGAQKRLLLTFETVKIEAQNSKAHAPKITSLFSPASPRIFEGTVFIRFEILSSQGKSERMGGISTRRTLPLKDHLTSAEKDQAIEVLIKKLVIDLDQRVRQSLQEHLPELLEE